MKWGMARGQLRSNCLHNGLCRIGASYSNQFREASQNLLISSPQTSSNNDSPVLIECFGYCLQGFFNGSLDKATRINHHYARIGIVVRNNIAFSTQLGQYPLRINQGLGATKTDKSDPGALHLFNTRLRRGSAEQFASNLHLLKNSRAYFFYRHLSRIRK